MPMDKSRYPSNWKEIALQKKQAANWTCEECDRECKRPDEDWLEFVQRVVFSRYACECPEALNLLAEIQEKPVRFVLTVAHLNQDPSDNRPANLRALCSVCHLRHDRPFRQYNSQRKRERGGQLSLLEDLAGHGKDMTRIQLTIGGTHGSRS